MLIAILSVIQNYTHIYLCGCPWIYSEPYINILATMLWTIQKHTHNHILNHTETNSQLLSQVYKIYSQLYSEPYRNRLTTVLWIIPKHTRNYSHKYTIYTHNCILNHTETYSQLHSELYRNIPPIIPTGIQNILTYTLNHTDIYSLLLSQLYKNVLIIHSAMQKILTTILTTTACENRLRAVL